MSEHINMKWNPARQPELYAANHAQGTCEECGDAASNPTAAPTKKGCLQCGIPIPLVGGFYCSRDCEEQAGYDYRNEQEAERVTADGDCPNCPNCGGETELNGTGGVSCFHCGYDGPASDNTRGDSGAATGRTSERPWEVGTGALTARNHAVCSGPRIVAVVTGTGYRGRWSPDSEADAALIVQAVNSFEAMRDALRGLFEHCAMVHKHWGDGNNQKEADAAIAAGLAALALAEGKQL